MKLSQAILISVIAHIAIIALLLFNFQFSKVEIQASGEAKPQIKARAINSQSVEQLVKELKQKDVNKKRQEQQRLDQLKQAEEKAKRKRVEEENKAAEAKRKQKIAEDKRKLEEKKATDLKKKRIKEEKERKLKQQQEAERKKKADAEKKRKAEAERKRKAKEEAERKRLAEERAAQQALEREMQAQMDAEAAEIAAAQQQQVNSEVAKFATLIEGKVTRNWIEPEQAGYCVFKLNVAQGGLVIGVTVIEGNPQHCESGKRAIYKSEPLPMSRDPDVFEVLRSINLTLGEKQTNE
jgi:colicin import membrane protein